MGDLKVRLYVKGVKTVSRAKKFGTVTFATQHVGQGIASPVTFDSETEAKYESILPEEQKKIVEIVEETTSKHGLELEVIDVTRENVFHRTIREELERIRSFPTLVLSSGERIEGRITKEQIESMLSRN
jgi:hypothetical protein